MVSTHSGQDIVQAERQFIRFRVSGADFCLDINDVKEIITYRAPEERPASVDTVAGFLSLRGISLPLIDIRKRFSLPEPGTEPAKILIVSFEGRVVGIAADEILDIGHGAAQSPAGNSPAAGTKGLAGVMMINTSAFLTPEERLFFDSPLAGPTRA